MAAKLVQHALRYQQVTNAQMSMASIAHYFILDFIVMVQSRSELLTGGLQDLAVSAPTAALDAQPEVCRALNHFTRAKVSTDDAPCC